MRDLTGKPQIAGLYKDLNHNEFTNRRIFAGAGAVILDALGLHLNGQAGALGYLNFEYLGAASSYAYQNISGDLVFLQGAAGKRLWLGFSHILPEGTIGSELGDLAQEWPKAWIKVLSKLDEIDPYQNTAKTVYFITQNIARNANVDHILAPSVDGYGQLGTSTNRWSAVRIANRLRIPVGTDMFDA